VGSVTVTVPTRARADSKQLLGCQPMSAAGGIVKAQQEYATSKNLAKLFEDLTTALIYARPADPAQFVSEEVARMAAAGVGYRPAAGVVDTEESAAAYWEEQRVRQLMEELFALLLACKPEDPLGFLREESLKLQALRAAKQPVRGAAPPISPSVPCRARPPLPPLPLLPPLPPPDCASNAHTPPRHTPPQSTMFSDDDLMGMFTLFDPTSNNYITADQARTALRNLGIKDLSSVCVRAAAASRPPLFFLTPAHSPSNRPEAGGTRIEAKAFIALARAALARERLL
jgi:hypothetical protein